MEKHKPNKTKIEKIKDFARVASIGVPIGLVTGNYIGEKIQRHWSAQAEAADIQTPEYKKNIKNLEDDYTFFLKNKNTRLPFIAVTSNLRPTLVSGVLSDRAWPLVRYISPEQVAGLVRPHLGDAPQQLPSHNIDYNRTNSTATYEHAVVNTIKKFTDQMQSIVDTESGRLKKDARAVGYAQLMVARNMRQVAEVNKEGTVVVSNYTIKKTVRDMHKARGKLHEYNILHNPVVLVGNNERYATPVSDPQRFTPDILKNLPYGVSPHVTTYSPERNASSEHIAAVKQNVLVQVADGQEETTFIFNGHGDRKGNFYLDNKGDAQSRISVAELGDALVKRYGSQKHDLGADKDPLNIVLVFGSCFSQNYVRELAVHLQKANIPLPKVMITTTEYGQYGYSQEGLMANSDFLQTLINHPNVVDFIHHKDEVKNQTPGVFTVAPNNPHVLMQIGGEVAPMDYGLGWKSSPAASA